MISLFSSLCCVLVTQLSLTLCNPMDCSLLGSSVHGILSPGKNTGVGNYSLLQGSFLIQGSPGSPTLQEDSLLSEPPGRTPFFLAFPYSYHQTPELVITNNCPTSKVFDFSIHLPIQLQHISSSLSLMLHIQHAFHSPVLLFHCQLLHSVSSLLRVHHNTLGYIITSLPQSALLTDIPFLMLYTRAWATECDPKQKAQSCCLSFFLNVVHQSQVAIRGATQSSYSFRVNAFPFLMTTSSYSLLFPQTFLLLLLI